jgi:hypothetical protein
MTDSTRDDDEPEDPRLLLLAVLIEELIEDLCGRHYDATTQEHQLSSRIAQAIEERLKELDIVGLRVSVQVQEMPDRGRGSLERLTGADLYISVVSTDEAGNTLSKGILVQSKWDDTLHSLGRLREQSEDMLARSEESYVWVYRREGVVVVPATELRKPRPDFDTDMTVGDLIGKAIECRAGDEDIGRDLDLPLVQSLNRKLEELRTPIALSFEVTRSHLR